MSIEPHVFLCYGRPDKDLALEIARGLWRDRIECYNYLARPVEDRMCIDHAHQPYVLAARLFAAILSPDTIWRQLVVDEIMLAERVASLAPDRRKRVYISTPATTSWLPFPAPDLLIDRTLVGGAPGIVGELVGAMGMDFAARAREAWEINRDLYPEEWRILDARYAAPSEADLPSAFDVLVGTLAGASAAEYLRGETAGILTAQHRWQFLSFAAEIVAHADGRAGRELQHAAAEAGHPEPREVMVPSHIGAKAYAPDERIASLSTVLRGMARIIACLANARAEDARSIAGRFTWPRTRRLLLCGIYGCALGAGPSVVARAVLADLSRSEP